MRKTLRMAALAIALALSTAVPAAATVLNFEFFSDEAKTTKLWGVVIDFGDFAFDENLSGVTTGITLTQPAAPFDTGAASYNYFEGGILSFTVSGNTSDAEPEFYTYNFSADCVPLCADGAAPRIFVFGVGGRATSSLSLIFAGFAGVSITDVTPTPPAAVIPLPAAGWLLLGGLGALGALRRRRA